MTATIAVDWLFQRINLRFWFWSAEYIDAKTGEIFGGDELIFKGITPIYENCDFTTFVKLFTKKLCK